MCSLSFFAVAHAQTDDSVLRGAKLVSGDDKTIQVDKQVMVVADLTNGQDRDQKFAYIVQIQNQDNIVVSLSWLTGKLSSGQIFSPAQSWIPIAAGTYTVQIFVWESLDNPTALSPTLLLKVNVVDAKV